MVEMKSKENETAILKWKHDLICINKYSIFVKRRESNQYINWTIFNPSQMENEISLNLVKIAEENEFEFRNCQSYSISIIPGWWHA